MAGIGSSENTDRFQHHIDHLVFILFLLYSKHCDQTEAWWLHGKIVQCWSYNQNLYYLLQNKTLNPYNIPQIQVLEFQSLTSSAFDLNKEWQGDTQAEKPKHPKYFMQYLGNADLVS